MENEPVDALNAFSKATKIDEDLVLSYYHASIVYEQEKQYTRALECIE